MIVARRAGPDRRYRMSAPVRCTWSAIGLVEACARGLPGLLRLRESCVYRRPGPRVWALFYLLGRKLLPGARAPNNADDIACFNELLSLQVRDRALAERTQEITRRPADAIGHVVE